MLQKRYPHNKTGFTYMRTNCEAPFMTTLFSELPVFFSTNNTTSLPPTLAVYLMVNALHQHGLTPQDFVRLCHETTPSKEDLRLLLNTVRDILCAWTACRYEGRYEPDTCLGKDSDHQPFKNACKPGTRVMDADDCEGRSQQACVHVRQLFVSIFLDNKSGRGRVREHFLRYPPNTGCLRFPSHTSMTNVMNACGALGYLFYTDAMQVPPKAAPPSFAAAP